MSEIKSFLEINNLTDFKISEIFLSNVASETLRESNLDCIFGKKISISLAFVCEEEIKRLNFEYRKKSESTDVLSFSEYAKKQDLCDNKQKDIFLGEIVMCPTYIEKSSVQQKVSFEFEIAYILSHGILHLLDFSHGDEMFSLQEKIANNIK